MSFSPLPRSELVANAQVAPQSGALSVARWYRISSLLPPPVMVLLSILSTQLGAATAKTLLASHAPSSIVLLRTGFAAIVLWLVAPPRMRSYSKQQWCCAALLGIAITVLSLSLYEAVSRIPLGITMTIEFLGPLTVAAAASRRTKDLIWPLLAFSGILLLTPTGNLRSLSLVGIAFAFLGAGAWAAYLVLAKRTTLIFSGSTGLTLAMTVATVSVLPLGLLSGGKLLLDLSFLVNGLWISALSTMVPFSLEFLALKRMSSRTLGILVSGEPSVAALVAVVMLHEHLALRAWVALAIVSIAVLGVMSQDARSREAASNAVPGSILHQECSQPLGIKPAHPITDGAAMKVLSKMQL